MSSESSYPIGHTQRDIIFDSLYSHGTGVWINQVSCDLIGALDVQAFQRAWQQLAERHAILRSSFQWKNIEAPAQVVQPHVEIPLAVHDWRHVDQREEQFEEFLRADRRRGFELSNAPLMRVALLQLDPNEYKLIWTFHQLLFDSASAATLLQEFATYYQGAPSPNTVDCFGNSQSDDRHGAEEFWTQTLRGFSAPTPLPLDAAQPETHSDIYDQLQLPLSIELNSALKSLSQQHQVQISTIIDGAWALLLSIYSTEPDVVFGVVSPRSRDLTEVGLLFDILPLRVQTYPDATILDFLQRLEEQQSQIREHAHVSLSRIKGWSDVPRNGALFESLVAYEDSPLEDALKTHLGVLEVRQPRSTTRPNYPLSLLVKAGESLSLELIYDRRRFSANATTRLLVHLGNLLAGMISNPKRRLSQLSPLTKEERRQILVEWNQTEADYSPNEFVHRMFEQCVEKQPAAVALAMERRYLSYENLNKKANQLAHYLRGMGVGPEVRVGVLLERSLDMVTAIFGILKAGGAYVPLDPTYPQDRLTYMLQNSGAPVLLTQESLAKHLPTENTQVVCVDRDRELIEKESTENPQVVQSPGSLAYVIYTSGSTGRPKGVAVEHRNLTAFLGWTQEIFDKDDLNGLLAPASICFDMSVFELFAPLVAGGKVILVDNALQVFTMWDAKYVTQINAVPSVLDVLLEHGGLPPSVHTLSFCGEALKSRTVQKSYEHKGVRKIVNLYGPTEDTVFSTFTLINKGTSDTPLIGRPITNTQVYLLDRYGNPVPVGVAGELHLAGASLSRGYLNRPDLTAERFIPNPFSREAGARMYRTGDLARYLPDGSLDFLGRMDHQVKVRGFRIELGEIESVLEQHPSVREAVVKATAGGLTAYFVSNQDEPPSAGDLSAFVQKKVPPYMVPSIFVRLEKWPKTTNGKIDRKALADPDAQRPSSQVTTPNTVERALVDIWREVLHVEQVRLADNFFELGGHGWSLLQLQGKAQQRFGKEVALAELSALPTVGEMARLFNVSEPAPELALNQVYERAKRQKEALAQQRQKLKEKR
jgi:amino acid adenylation domain-containing protein